jgi:hypothetical protein
VRYFGFWVITGSDPFGPDPEINDNSRQNQVRGPGDLREKTSKKRFDTITRRAHRDLDKNSFESQF